MAPTAPTAPASSGATSSSHDAPVPRPAHLTPQARALVAAAASTVPFRRPGLRIMCHLRQRQLHNPCPIASSRPALTSVVPFVFHSVSSCPAFDPRYIVQLHMILGPVCQLPSDLGTNPVSQFLVTHSLHIPPSQLFRVERNGTQKGPTNQDKPVK